MNLYGILKEFIVRYDHLLKIEISNGLNTLWKLVSTQILHFDGGIS